MESKKLEVKYLEIGNSKAKDLQKQAYSDDI